MKGRPFVVREFKVHRNLADDTTLELKHGETRDWPLHLTPAAWEWQKGRIMKEKTQEVSR